MNYRTALLLSLLLIGVVGTATFILFCNLRSPDGSGSEAVFGIPPDTPQISFDADRWRADRYGGVRAEMLNDLLQTHGFRGWSRDDVIALLGHGDVGGRPECEIYVLMQVAAGNSAHGCLRFVFDKDNTVAKYELVIVWLPI